MANKVTHFVNTARNVVTHAVNTGRLKAEVSVVKMRKEICSSCEFLYKTRCQKCGCFISSKTSLEAADCPMKKW